MKLFLTLLISLILFNVYGQTNRTIKYYSNNSMEISSIINLSTDFYILLNESIIEFDQKNSIIIKTNNNLEVIDTLNFNFPDYYYISKFLIVDSNIVLFGMLDTITNNFEFGNLFIAKLDLNGKLLNYKLIQNQFLEIPRDIKFLNNKYYITSNTMMNNNSIRYYASLRILDDSLNIINKLVDSTKLNVYFDRIDELANNELAISGAFIGNSKLGGRTIIVDTLLNVIAEVSDSTILKDQLNLNCASWISTSSVRINNNIYNLVEYDTQSHLNPNNNNPFKRIGIKKTNLIGFNSMHVFHFDSTYTDKPLFSKLKNNNIQIFGTLDNHSILNKPNRNGNFLFMEIDTNMNIKKMHQFGDANYQQLRGVLEIGNKYLFYGYEKDYIINKKTPYIYLVDNIDSYTSINNSATKNNSISIYPNPSTSEFNIRSSEKIKNITIYNSNSQLFMTEDFDDYDVKVNLNENGLFFVRVQTEGGVYVEKVMINQ